MIESLISPRGVKKKPWKVFIAGFVFTFVACLLVAQVKISGSGSGLLIAAFITIPATPFFVSLFKIEEKKQRKKKEKSLREYFTERHLEVVQILGYFFLSVIFASSLFYIIAPKTSAVLFTDQVNELESRGIITAEVIGGPGFTGILFNNFKILGLTFVFSFVFGAGAIFVLSWNACVLGVLIAKIAELPAKYGSITIVEGNVFANYAAALPFAVIKLLPHGIFEFSGYFLGAVAGGIFSVAIIRERLLVAKGEVFKDSLVYLILASVCILIGALIEVML